MIDVADKALPGGTEESRREDHRKDGDAVILAEEREFREGESPPHPRGVSNTRPIDAAKEAVTVLELAERLVGGPLTRKGDSFTARCPLPDHEDKTPSFNVYVDNGRGWTCFGCRRGGDVVHLFALAHGHDNLGVAAGYLLLDFGHELPQRPPSWFRRQERQGPVRDAIEEARFDHLRRRLFRRFFVPSLVAIEDAQERDDEAAILWEATEKLARLLLRDLEEGRSA